MKLERLRFQDFSLSKNFFGCRLIKLFIAFGLFFCFGISDCRAQGDSSLIVNEEKPAKAKEFFFKAMKEWLAGKKKKALELYEIAVIADRSILAENDMGMSHALIEFYREKVVKSPSPTILLYRLGYFENVISGNLQQAIQDYEKVLLSAKDPNLQTQAKIEMEKLSRELDYIQKSKVEQEEKTKIVQEKDLEQYLEKDREDERERQISDLEDEKESLREKIAGLQIEEKEARDELNTRLDRMNRYGRHYYFDDMPDGNASDTTPEVQSGHLELYYVNRRKVQEQEERIGRIRSEISKTESAINAIDVKIARIREEKR